ncbi:MAG: hypothetical protein II794_08020 [Oscillospiraceae bacterium]|nr:hypothetical protein [Oscillospiraceae bacterium]
MKDLFAGKKLGFYVTLALAVLAVITAFVYLGMYNGTNYMSRQAFFLLLAGAVLAVVLAFLGQGKFSPAVLFGAAVLALMFFVYYIYFFVSSVLTGIQYTVFPVEFVTCVVLFGLLLVGSIVNVFLPQVEEK